MPFRTIRGKRVMVHEPSPEHPSAHGATSKLANDEFVAGVKLAQAKERLQSSAQAGKPHAKLSQLAGKVANLQSKHDRLMEKRIKKGL